jgi:hypothetical protein
MRASHRLVSTALALAFSCAEAAAHADTANETPLPPAQGRSREVKLIVLADTMGLGRTAATMIGAHAGVQLGRWFSLESGVDTFVPLREGGERIAPLIPLLAWVHLGPDEHTIDLGGGPELSTRGGGAIYRTGLAYRYARAFGGLVVRAGVDLAWAQVRWFGSSSWYASGLQPHLSIGWRL